MGLEHRVLPVPTARDYRSQREVVAHISIGTSQVFA